MSYAADWDYRDRIEWEHRVVERHGGSSKDRAFAETVNGRAAIIVARLAPQGIEIDSPIWLPERLRTHVERLRDFRLSWVERIAQPPRRPANIIAAVDVIEAFCRHLAGRAEFCEGSSYLVHRIVNIISDGAQRIANSTGEIHGVMLDATFEEAGLEIGRLLNAASCRKAA